MIKTRVKDFILDLKDGRIYSVCISFCKCRNNIQRQLEIEYSGYLDGFKRINNNEKQIINQTLQLSKFIYDKTSLSLEPTIERKFDFVNLNTLHNKINHPMFISGPHGSGKTTLLNKMLNKNDKLFTKNNFEIDFVKEFPSIKSLSHFERSLIRLFYRKFRTDYANSITKNIYNKIILTDRSVYDSIAYINVYKKLDFILKGLAVGNPNVIILNPPCEVIKSRLNQRKIKGKRGMRDAMFKHEDTDLFIHLLHNAFKRFKHKPDIIYIEDNSDEEIGKILSQIKSVTS